MTKEGKKKNILITGAGRGIGFAIAKAVEDDAKNLILVTKSKTSIRHLEKSFPKAKRFGVDLSNEENVLELVKKVKHNFHYLDVLVNNAGFYVGKKFEETSTAELDELYTIHLKAPFLLIQKFLPLLKRSDCPQVINISSAAVFAALQGESAYAAVKAGLSAMGNVLRNELQKHHIRFATIYPWTVNTKNFKNPENFLRPQDIGEIVAFIINAHPNCQILNIEVSSVSEKLQNCV